MSSVFPPGVQLATRYRVLRVLETNHVGALFEAEQVGTRRRVALKWLRFGVGHTQLAQQRAARARAAILVRHPQLAVVHDVAHEGSSLFVVSELLRGEPLRARLAPHAMPLHERLRALADAGRAVAFAHQEGVVHGGLHPGNIFLHREHDAWVGLPPVVKVHDFGTATNTMPECLAYPAERSALGAHAFLDHAQLCGAEPDAQSDIYAYAVLLFQALTGCVPFAAKSPIELAVTLATSPVPTVGDRHAGLPAPLDALIHQSLQHQRDERPKRLDLLATQVSAYAEALAARELLAADDNHRTRRLVSDRAAPGAQVTRLLTTMGDDAATRSALRSFATDPPAAAPGPAATPAVLPAATPELALAVASVTAPLAVPALPPFDPAAFAAALQQAAFDAAVQHARWTLNQQHTAAALPLPPLALGTPATDTEVAEDEQEQPPTMIGEAQKVASHSDAQRAGYAPVVGSTRFSPQLKFAPESPRPVSGNLARALQSPRVRAWSAAAAAIVALAGLGTSLAITADPEDPSLSTPPALPSVYHAQPAPHRRRRDPMLVDVRGSSAGGSSVDAPAASAREPSVDAPDASAREREVDEKPEQPERYDRQAVDSLDEATDPARGHPLERVPSSLARGRSERLENRPVRVEQASNDGFRVGTPPTQDQF